MNQLEAEKDNGLLDLGCVASHGHFVHEKESDKFKLLTESKAATAFLFKLISELQFSGTVPMIDIQAYGNWLIEDSESTLA